MAKRESLPINELLTPNGNRIKFGTAAPTTGTYKVGDIVINTTPSAGAAFAWSCSVAGTPGTWIEPPAMASVTATAAELNYNDIAVLGTGAASKSVVLDANGNYTMPDNGFFGLSSAALAAAGNSQATYAVVADQVNAVTGADGTKGVALPAAAAGRAILIVNTDASNTLPVAPVNAGDDTINALTAGTGVFTMGPGSSAWFIPTSATQWYVADMTSILATSTEITRVCDVSTRVVNCTSATLAVTEADHGSKTIVLDRAAGIAVTLPVASAGLRFRFVVKTTFTGAASIKSVSGADIMIGHALMGNDTDNTVVDWQSLAASTNDTIDLFGTANSTGGIAGQVITIEGLAANLWYVEIRGDAAGTEATPFANTVA